jgi:hypothetical protein
VNDSTDLTDAVTENKRAAPSRRRRGVVAVSAAVAVAVAVVVVGAVSGMGDEARSGTLVTGQATYVTDAWGDGEYFGRTPRLAAYVTVPNATLQEMKGAKVEVSARVEYGCLAFGTQTKTFDWDAMAVTNPNDPSTFLNRQFRWDFPTIGSNVCVWSTYKIKARVRAANGTVTAWSAEATVVPD